MLRGVFFVLLLLLGMLPGEHGHLSFDEPVRECAICTHTHQTPGMAPPGSPPAPERFAQNIAPALPNVEAFINGRLLFRRAPKVSPPA